MAKKSLKDALHPLKQPGTYGGDKIIRKEMRDARKQVFGQPDVEEAQTPGMVPERGDGALSPEDIQLGGDPSRGVGKKALQRPAPGLAV